MAIAAAVVAYVLIVTAVLISPWFSWYNNALSDLGNSAAQRNIASGADWVLNTGLVVAGVLTAVFGVQLSRDWVFVEIYDLDDPIDHSVCGSRLDWSIQ
ncbi:MAG: DUF998 domain-containing protein [Thaumarchaeota archaeon]|nr:DUF998 domain-containing protein [Nitrososphaerota archaeon]